MQKTVIASNVDGIAEIIENKVNGILINPDKDITFKKLFKDEVPIPQVVINPKTQELQKPKEIDPSKLSEAIEFLLDKPNIRQLYGNTFTKLCKFVIENYQEKLEKIYQILK